MTTVILPVSTTPPDDETMPDDEPMNEALSQELAQELAQWQELGRQAVGMFPYEEEAA